MRTRRSAIATVRGWWRRFARELAGFGTVGALAFVVDVGTFNLLIATVWDGSPLRAKVVAVVVATLFSWVGNRLWTYRDRRRTSGRGLLPELGLFLGLNGVALAISLLILALSHHAMGLTSPLADNVANVVGIALGTAFRFYAYRTWVFRAVDEGRIDDGAARVIALGDPPLPVETPHPRR